jgi:hypothetical protein
MDFVAAVPEKALVGSRDPKKKSADTGGAFAKDISCGCPKFWSAYWGVSPRALAATGIEGPYRE